MEMNKQLFSIHSEFCRTFSHEKRLMIMWLLSDGELSVGQIAESLDLPLANISQHLRIMRDRGALASRKLGQTVYYRVSNPKFIEGLKKIREGLIELHEERGNALLPKSVA